MPPTLSSVDDQATKIPYAKWYIIGLAVLLGAWLLTRLTYCCCRWIFHRRRAISFRRAFGSPLPLLRRLDLATLRELLLIALVLTANIIPLALSARSWADVQRRAANLAVFNLIPLWTGLTFGLPADLLGVTRATVAWSHRWLGRLVAVHSLLHGAIIIAAADNPAASTRHHYIALLAVTAFLAIVPVTLHAIVRRHPQLAMKAHYLLAVTTMVALVYHAWSQRSRAQWFLAGAGILWVVLTVAAGINAVVIKRLWDGAWPVVTPPSFHDLLRLDITVSTHWDIQPGQYVYVWMPYAGFRACLQLPLFYVAFWGDTPKQRSFYVLTRPQPTDLTARLYSETSLHHRQCSALVFGPYGQPVDFTLFGTIVFIVEDIGIMRVLPFIRMLVQASEKRCMMVRQLDIVWQMDDFAPCHQCWLAEWMQELLDLDGDEFKILRFSLYYRQNSTAIEPGDRLGERISLLPGSMPAREVTLEHLNNRRGKTAVGVCARPSIGNPVRNVVHQQSEDEIKLVDLDLEPYHAWENIVSEPEGVSHVARTNHQTWVASRVAEGDT